MEFLETTKSLSREDEAKQLEENVLPEIEAELAVTQIRHDEIKADILRLKTFDSPEAEAAFLIAECMRSKGEVGVILEALKMTKGITAFGK